MNILLIFGIFNKKNKIIFLSQKYLHQMLEKVTFMHLCIYLFKEATFKSVLFLQFPIL